MRIFPLVKMRKFLFVDSFLLDSLAPDKREKESRGLEVASTVVEIVSLVIVLVGV